MQNRELPMEIYDFAYFLEINVIYILVLFVVFVHKPHLRLFFYTEKCLSSLNCAHLTTGLSNGSILFFI